MSSAVVAGIAGMVLCGPSAYLLGPWLLRRIPEPVLDEGQTKTPYRELATRRAARWCGLLGAAGGGLVGWRIGFSAALVAWLLLVVAGAVLGYVDARTHFLPSAIVWPTYLAVGIALLVGAAVSGEWSMMLRAVIAGVAGFAVFHLLWFVFPGKVGYGDVRLSGLLSLALGWLGWGELVTGLYGGFLLGAVIGIVLTAAKVFKRREMFAFGPFMLAGAVLGVLFGDWLERLYLG